MKRDKPLRRTPMKRGGRIKPKPRRDGAMPHDVYWSVMVKRAGGECEIRVPHVCTRNAGEWSHRQRRQRGNDRPSNGLAACSSCHAWCHAHPQEAKEKGWMVHSHHPDPSLVPVWWRRGWWLLDDDGGREPHYETSVL